ncbi:MAG: PKD domain-containing protein, partial [Thermoplasmata archaeon]
TTLAILGGPITIAPHVAAWSIVYDPSREFLYIASTSSPAWPGNLTVIDGSSIAASEGAYLAMPLGQLSVDLQPVLLPGSSAPGASEIWVDNYVSGTISIVASPPQVVYLAALPDPVDVGAQSQVLLGLTGGAGPTVVSYSGLPSGCQSADTAVLSCTPTASGGYTVGVVLVDRLGESTTASTSLSVSPSIILSLTIGESSSPQVDVGSALNASVVSQGGTGPFNYTWNFGDAGTAFGTPVSHVYGSPGRYVVTVTTTDAGGGVSSASRAVTVEPIPTATLSVSPGAVTDVNVPLNFTAVVRGGTSPVTGYWNFTDGTTSSGLSVVHSFTTSAIYYARFYYRDSSGSANFSSLSVTVNPSLSATLKVTSPSSGASATAGSPVSFSTAISGGTGPYSVVWAFDDGSYAYGLSPQHTYASAGTYTVTVVVQDAVGAEKNTTYALVVGSASSSSSFGSSFTSGIILGIVVGAAAAAVILFATTRPKRPQPVMPPSPYVPPGPAGSVDSPPWNEG